MKENCNTCDPCEENFWNEVKEIVDNVKNYTKKDHEEKRKRCRTLFPKKKAKTATKLSLRENKLTGPKQKKKERFHVPFSFEPQVGLEPTTFSLRMKCSTD